MIHPQTFLAVQASKFTLSKGRQRQNYYNSLKDNKLKSEMVFSKVIEYFGLTKESILSKNRHAKLVEPRHIAMYLIKKKTSLSDGEVAKFFNRDRTTILHATHKIHSYLKINNPESIIDDIKNIELLILNQSLYETT